MPRMPPKSARLRKEFTAIHVLELDVTNDASVEQAVDAAVAKAGRIDVAINKPLLPLGLGKLSHRTSAASHGHEFFWARSRNPPCFRTCGANAGVLITSAAAPAAWFSFWGFYAPANCT